MAIVLSERRKGLRRPLRFILIAAGSVLLMTTMLAWAASAAPGTAGADGNGLCRIDVTANGSTENVVSTAPTSEAAGTYTAQFFNGSNAITTTTATITHVNTGAAACPASPLVGRVAN